MNINEDISLLIIKQLLGSITAEEQCVLDDWRHENPYNEAVYQRLHNNEQLLVEHHRDQLTDYQRPLSEMKARLGIRQHRRRFYVAAAIATIVLLVGSAWFFNRQLQTTSVTESQPAIAFSAGSTKAVLTLGNGKTVELTEDAIKNQQLLAAAQTEKTENSNSEPIEQVLATPRGGEFRVMLEDGTEVWLNAASRLVYPEEFEGNERRVELDGEAYFKVAKNPDKPFIVISGGQEVHVYGTEFNVHAYSDEPDIYTTLVEGSIALRLSGSQNQSRELLLSPGHQTVFNQQSSLFNVKEVDTDVVTSWRSGVFVFENQTLEQIMLTLSRWYDFDYEFLDRQTAETVFMGSIPKYGTFSEVSDIFDKLGGIRLRQQGRKIIISAK